MKLNIPDLLYESAVLLLLCCRRLRYGYAFRLIPLTQGKFAIVAPEDYERLSVYRWWALNQGKTWYAISAEKIDGRKKYIYMHRKILEVGPDLMVDHINHNGLDNRKANLRPASHSQNMCNRLALPHSSRFKGVSWSKRYKKWLARIVKGKKYNHLGIFDDEIDAARAYDKAAKELYGEFALLNFPHREKSFIKKQIVKLQKFIQLICLIYKGLLTKPVGGIYWDFRFWI